MRATVEQGEQPEGRYTVTMAISTCPTCRGTGFDRGSIQTTITAEHTTTRANRCWCSWWTPKPQPQRGKAVYWLDETPPGKMTEVVQKFLATDEALDLDELNTLKAYIGQWCDNLMILARAHLPQATLAAQQEIMAGWESQIAAAHDRQSLWTATEWLLERGVDPF